MASFKQYKIKKGKHYSGFRISPTYNKMSSKYEVIFKENCIYDLHDEDQYDVNKLFGLSYGYHHINSARFGWRADGEKIQLSLYCYREGQRYMKDICQLDTERTYTLEIKNEGTYYEFLISGNTSSFMAYGKITKPQTPKLGYNLFPYFGGNEPAPHDIEILMKKIK